MRYEEEFDTFVKWRSDKNVCVALVLKFTLSIKKNVQTDKFPILIAYLKRRNVGGKLLYVEKK